MTAFLALFLSISRADTWQCPGHEPSVSFERLESLDERKMDPYRGYKPAWMALEGGYRNAVYNWNDMAVRDAYLADRNHYLDPYMYHESVRRLVAGTW